jgi:hypothetical protein
VEVRDGEKLVRIPVFGPKNESGTPGYERTQTNQPTAMLHFERIS